MAFTSLTNIWKSRHISTKTKLQFFNSYIKSVLLYCPETWRMTKKIASKVQTFINGCLQKILRIFWPETVNNKGLWKRTGQLEVDKEIKKQKWRHPQKAANQHCAPGPQNWKVHGKRKRRRPRNTWRRDLESKACQTGYNLKQLERLAKDRTR